MKKYFLVTLSCLIIGIVYNLFFIPFDLVPSGLIGLGAIFQIISGYNAAIIVAISNIILLTISLLFFGIKKTNKYLLTSLLIPLFIFLTRDITKLIMIKSIELLIVAIAGAGLTGFCYSLIYNEGLSIGGIEIIQDIFNSARKNSNRTFTYIIDFIVVLICFILLNFESAIYTLIITIIVVYFSTKSKHGIRSNKTFFIITTKEKEVKDYIINELNYDFTEFNIKGGFTNQKNKIIMSVIDTKDYYRFKEGISLIDEKAFISIIENYESINNNKTFKEKKRKKLTK